MGEKIAKALSIGDKTAFLHGSIAPDAVFLNEEKNRSHFFIGEAEDFSRSVDYHEFLHKYRSQINHPYIMGYFAHLIADDIWLRGFYLSWLRNRMDADQELYKLYHNDFQLLNGKLLEHYRVKDELVKSFTNFPAILDLEELNSKDVEKLVPFVLSDMEYEKEVLNEKLNVFTFNQIIGYIETSVEVGIMRIKPFLQSSLS